MDERTARDTARTWCAAWCSERSAALSSFETAIGSRGRVWSVRCRFTWSAGEPREFQVKIDASSGDVVAVYDVFP
jgi:hypothetical protein